jgi:hypothetical protein
MSEALFLPSLVVPQAQKRRRRSLTGQDVLARRLGRRTGRNEILDPSVGQDTDPKTPIRRALRGLWKSYHRTLRRKDRCAVLLRDASTHLEQIRLANEIARHDRDLADLDMALAHLEEQLPLVVSRLSIQEATP